MHRSTELVVRDSRILRPKKEAKKMPDYWLIYTHTDRLEGPQAKRFEDGEDIQNWIDEQSNIKVLDCIPCSEDEED